MCTTEVSMTDVSKKKARNNLKELTFNQAIYKEYEHGIYYCTTYTPARCSPKSLTIDGKVYTRFLDFIYMPCETHELTNEQCIAVNDIRNIYFETHKDMLINRKVKQHIATLINQLCANNNMTLLEYGCGYQTIHGLLKVNTSYVGTDINHKVVAKNKKTDLTGRFFIMDKENIPINNGTIDFIVSIFVFHFNVTTQQLSQLFNMLSDNGVMVFNLYLLPKNQRQALFLKIEKIGFFYHREMDVDELCQNHEYCILAKSPNALLFKKAVTLFKTNHNVYDKQIF